MSGTSLDHICGYLFGLTSHQLLRLGILCRDCRVQVIDAESPDEAAGAGGFVREFTHRVLLKEWVSGPTCVEGQPP
jgi:hypothetical protein